MRVINVESAFLRGHGVANSIAMILREISRTNSDLTLEVLCNESRGLSEDGLPPSVRITTTGRKNYLGYGHFSFFPELLRLDADENTVVHLHHPVAVWPLLRKRGKKIATWHGNNNQNWNDPTFGPLYKRLMRRGFLDISTYMLRSVDRVVTISDFLRGELVGYYRLPARLVERIYWGVDVDTFKPTNVDKGYMLFAGRHVHYKNIRDLIDLARELKFPLICVGDGVEKSKLEEYAKQKGAPVEFKGKVPLTELVELYQGCSFYVTASKWEGFGLPLIEAGATGKPVIAPNNSAHPEVVVDTKTGLIYRNRNELLDATKSLITDQIRRRDMGIAARIHVAEKFDVRQTAEKYVQIYRSL